MADYTTQNLELIVRYDGSKSSFDSSNEKASYINAKISKVVFITGSTASNASTADKTQHIWVSNGTSHKYLDMTNINDIKDGLAHIAGFAIEGDIKSGAGANGINFKGVNGVAVKLNPEMSEDTNGVEYWTIEVDGLGVKQSLIGVDSNGSDSATHSDTIRGAKAYADSLYAKLKGQKASDDTTAETIRGAKDYADNAVAKIVSDGNDAATDDTIKGAKLYTDLAKESLLGKNGDASTENTIYGAKAYADTKDITIDSTNNDDTLAGKFVIKKNNIEIATINIPKELVVTEDGSEIVKGTWTGDIFTEVEGGLDKALKLAIQNQKKPIYINVADLVDVYTAATGTEAVEVQIAISDNNVISATIGNVSGTKIFDNSIAKTKLDDLVKESLDKANSAIQDITTDTSKYIEIPAPTDATNYNNKVVNLKTSTMQQATAADLAGSTVDGVIPTQDIYEFLKARLSVKVVS